MRQSCIFIIFSLLSVICFAQSTELIIGEQIKLKATKSGRFNGFLGEYDGLYYYMVTPSRGNWSIHEVDADLNEIRKAEFGKTPVGETTSYPDGGSNNKGIHILSSVHMCGDQLLILYYYIVEGQNQQSVYATFLDLQSLETPKAPKVVATFTAKNMMSVEVAWQDDEIALLYRESNDEATYYIKTLDRALNEVTVREVRIDAGYYFNRFCYTLDGSLTLVGRHCEEFNAQINVCDGSFKVYYLEDGSSELQVVQSLDTKTFRECDFLWDGSTYYFASIYAEEPRGKATGTCVLRFNPASGEAATDFREFSEDQNTYPGPNEDSEDKNPAELGYDDYITLEMVKGADGNLYVLHQMRSGYMGQLNGFDRFISGYGDLMITKADNQGKIQWNSRIPLYQSSNDSGHFGASLHNSSSGVAVIFNNSPKAADSDKLKSVRYMKRTPYKGDMALYAMHIQKDGSFKKEVLTAYKKGNKHPISPRNVFHGSAGTFLTNCDYSIAFPVLLR